jgi:hypothetical protein
LNKLRKFAASIGVTFVAFSSLLYTTPAAADTVSGLNVAVYTYDSSSTPEMKPYTLCNDTVATAWTHVENIDVDYDGQFGGIVAGCQGDFVLVHYTGYVTFPYSGSYAFRAWADDGFWMSLDGTPVIAGDWVLKGRWGSVYPDVAIEGGHTYAFDAWYYEYGGGANATLTYSPDNGNIWETVPNTFFTTEATPQVVPPVVAPPVVPPVDPQPPVVPPVVVPPVVPPVVIDPPVVVPPKGPVVEPKPPVEIPPVSPPVVEPPKVTPPQVPVAPVESSLPPIATVDPSTINPQVLTTKEVAQLQEVAIQTLATVAEDSPQYQQALEQLAVAAKADDILVDPQIASVPVIGAVAVGVTNAINAIGNIGADMSPAHRATAKKEVVAAVIVTQVATTAAGIATQAAASAAAGAGSASIRRKE